MTINEQQQRAIVFLAVACRPTGARRWQEAGVAAAVAKIAHRSLPDVILATVKAASDRNAETPGVIPTNGPHWSEGSVQPAWEPEKLAPNERCGICSHGKHDSKCPRCAPIDDHAFEPACTDRQRPADAMAAIVTELRERKTPTTEEQA